MSLRFRCAMLAGKLTAGLIRLIDKERGTRLPGVVALKVDPQLLRHIKGVTRENTVFVTGTNGKSTTTNLIAHALLSAGRRVVCNFEGANLESGVVSTLLKQTGWDGRLKGDVLLLETDERFLPIISEKLPPGHLLVTNIQKDQVQRNGEPDLILKKIASVINKDVTLYLNNDEPNSGGLAQLAGKVVRYGVSPHSRSFNKKDDFFAVTQPCPICGSPIRFETYNIDNIGPFHCSACDYASAPRPDFLAEEVDLEACRFTVNGEPYGFTYSTPYFLYCYIGAVAVARGFGLTAEEISSSFLSFQLPGGRLEDVRAGGHTIRYLRMKQENPETVQSAIDVIAADHSEKILLLGLDELVDFHPHYTNTFYTYDCDFSGLIDSDVSHYICFSGTVAYDAALRLMYAGVPREKITILPTNDDATIVAELNKHECANVYLITWLHKYEHLAEYAKKHAEA
ncbi:MAG: DUF1727 domain-containing protein [Firmicutes bacterium]|nr:DUF1727 domain-containing protein [Bacillota bacterium]